jgi:hypothetical protein
VIRIVAPNGQNIFEFAKNNKIATFDGGYCGEVDLSNKRFKIVACESWDSSEYQNVCNTFEPMIEWEEKGKDGKFYTERRGLDYSYFSLQIGPQWIDVERKDYRD